MCPFRLVLAIAVISLAAPAIAADDSTAGSSPPVPSPSPATQARAAHSPSEQVDPANPRLRRAARDGDAFAQFVLALGYLRGDRVKHDPVLAAQWMAKAAKQDSPIAQAFLGQMYLSGTGVTQDSKQAMHWLTLAAGNGDNHARIQLGQIYLSDRIVPHDYDKARQIFLDVARHTSLALPKVALGEIYYRGLGVPASNMQAVKWLLMAQQSDFENAALKEQVSETLKRLQPQLSAQELATAKAAANVFLERHEGGE